MKMILIEPSVTGGELPESMLAYYSSSQNQGVAPGDFSWSERNGGKTAERNPWRSMQIFEEALDFATFESAFQEVRPTIPDAELLVATFNGTTINNSVYGVKAGQKVEILMFRVNSIVPTAIFLTQEVKKYTVILAELTRNIATNEGLLNEIRTFLEA